MVVCPILSSSPYNKACSCFSTSNPRSVPSYEVEMRRLGLNLSQVRELTGLLCGFHNWTPLLAPSKSLTSHKPMPPSLPPAAARTLSSMGWMATEKILSLTTLATRSSLIVMLESLFRHSSSSPPKLELLEVFSFFDGRHDLVEIVRGFFSGSFTGFFAYQGLEWQASIVIFSLMNLIYEFFFRKR